MQEMRQALQEERERRANEGQGQQQGGGQGEQPQGNQKQRIVAPIAELRALRAMQDRVTKNLERLEKQNLPDDASKLTPYQKATLERLAHQQGTIRTMWRDFAKTIGMGEEIFHEPDPDGSPEGGEEER